VRTELAPLLSFAARARVPGGFGYLGGDGTVLTDRPVETWISARMTHVFALATLLDHPGAADLAAHGVASLREGPLRDAEHGGWRSAVGAGADDDTKAAYVHAFAVLAGASATAAGVDGGRALLDEALDVWERRFWDDAEGLAVEEWTPDWSALSDYRGANANMHGVEATLAAADALGGDDAGRLRRRALRSVERVVHGWTRERDWRLPEHFTADWTPLPEHNRDRPADPFRPYGVTVGHQFEWARLALHLRAALQAAGEDPPAWLLEDAVALFDAAAGRGWAADGAPGFPYTLDWDDRPVVAARMHWVLCEAVAAATVLAAVTGDPRYGELAGTWWAHGEERFADPTTGSWHHETTPSGEVATGTWTGQPDAYHLAQALLLDGRPVRGSVAAALR
jgi:mannose/cellobiose epimerase-like protein (N-acyl-D-glucosamine 2-epimerase family)